MSLGGLRARQATAGSRKRVAQVSHACYGCRAVL